jgi:SRSO17 transposase
VIHQRGPWRSFAAVEFATLEWVDWFNTRRLLEPIGNMPPQRPKRATMPRPRGQPWPPDPNQTASGKPGAVHGVARQYCGQAGKQDNCQIAVTLSVANAHASLPVACRLYLPEAWTQDPERRAKAGMPDEVAFRTKPEIALDEIRATLQAGVSPGVVLADAGYGVDTAFRTALTGLGLTYILGIQSSTTLWPPGTAPLPPKPWTGKGRPPTRIRRDPHHTPLSARDLAKTLPNEAW